MAALQSPKLSVGVRVPGGTPVNCPGGEMVYTEDLKSSVCNGHAGSSPAPGTK
jgi:hypothetical protein